MKMRGGVKKKRDPQLLWHIHWWKIKWDTGVYHYQECRWCGKRRAVQVATGYQALDRRWPNEIREARS